jgi:hypothetical protein
MALIQKSNPINEDVVIAAIQTQLYNDLLLKGITNYESYERVYLINGVPELYIGGGNYKEVYFDDRFNLTSFFLLGETKTIDELGYYSTTLSIIFQADLSKLLPTITHRADSELHDMVKKSLDKVAATMELKEIVTGINNVYQGLDFENSQYLNDVSSYHLFRVNLDIQFSESCN